VASTASPASVLVERQTGTQVCSSSSPLLSLPTNHPTSSALRPHQASQPTHVCNGKHHRRPPLPQRSHRPSRRPRHDLRLRPNRKLQPGSQLLARGIPRRSLHASLHSFWRSTADIHDYEQGLGLRSGCNVHE
jgi:hypothetical protein